MLTKLKQWATRLKRQLLILYLATKHTKTPWLAKVVATFTLLYALSPIDLIPDFIPILGLLDDILLLPLGIWLAIRLIPDEIWQACKAEALANPQLPKKNKLGIALILITWLVIGLLAYLKISA